MLAGENGLVYQEKLEFLLHSPGYVWNRVQQKKLMKICSSCVPRAENSKEPSLGHVNRAQTSGQLRDTDVAVEADAALQHVRSTPPPKSTSPSLRTRHHARTD